MPINAVVILGNLTRDPELRALPSGTSVCDLGVAVNERVKGQDGQWEDRASFFDVTVFGKAAESAAKYLAKGRQVAINGRLRQERWQAQDGSNRSRVKIVANDVQFIGGRDEGTAPSGQGAWGGQHAQSPADQGDFGAPPPAPANAAPAADDDIPF